MSPEDLPLPDLCLATQGDSSVQCFPLEEKHELLLFIQCGNEGQTWAQLFNPQQISCGTVG